MCSTLYRYIIIARIRYCSDFQYKRSWQQVTSLHSFHQLMKVYVLFTQPFYILFTPPALLCHDNVRQAIHVYTCMYRVSATRWQTPFNLMSTNKSGKSSRKRTNIYTYKMANMKGCDYLGRNKPTKAHIRRI